MGFKLAYLSYPYSDDPKKRTNEVRELAKRIAAKYRDLILIVPHLVVDALFDHPRNRYDYLVQTPMMEYELIERCEIFIIGCELDYKLSPGSVWEHAYAKWRGKAIYTSNDLLRDD